MALKKLNWSFWRGEPYQRWRAIVPGLRSVAARLKGFRSRLPRMDDWQADYRFEELIGWLRPTLVKKRGGESYNRRNFGGIELQALLPEHVKITIRTKGISSAKQFTLRLLEELAMKAFASIVIEHVIPGACGRCGVKLEFTATGRPSRRRFCKGCAFKEWNGRQTESQRRKRWREAKAQQREETNN
jgi:hypothetical protein